MISERIALISPQTEDIYHQFSSTMLNVHLGLPYKSLPLLPQFDILFCGRENGNLQCNFSLEATFYVLFIKPTLYVRYLKEHIKWPLLKVFSIMPQCNTFETLPEAVKSKDQSFLQVSLLLLHNNERGLWVFLQPLPVVL